MRTLYIISFHSGEITPGYYVALTEFVSVYTDEERSYPELFICKWDMLYRMSH